MQNAVEKTMSDLSGLSRTQWSPAAQNNTTQILQTKALPKRTQARHRAHRAHRTQARAGIHVGSWMVTNVDGCGWNQKFRLLKSPSSQHPSQKHFFLKNRLGVWLQLSSRHSKEHGRDLSRRNCNCFNCFNCTHVVSVIAVIATANCGSGRGVGFQDVEMPQNWSAHVSTCQNILDGWCDLNMSNHNFPLISLPICGIPHIPRNRQIASAPCVSVWCLIEDDWSTWTMPLCRIVRICFVWKSG